MSTPGPTTVIAKTAADRARTLRHHVSTISDGALEPLRAAWRMRAAELELVADVFAGDVPVPRTPKVLVETGPARQAIA